MLSVNRSYDGENRKKHRVLMLRLLNDATAICIKISPQNTFRPTITVLPNIDKTAEDAANEVATFVQKNEDEIINEITVKSIIALLSTKLEKYHKVAIVNLTIKWLIANELEETVRNSLLMSIIVQDMTLKKVAKIRLAIHIYLTTPELHNYFNIHLNNCGFIPIERKSFLPGESSIYSLEKRLEFCKAINNVTDNYINPYWPELTKRNDIGAPRFKKGKLRYPPSFVFTEKTLENPLYQFNFVDQGKQHAWSETSNDSSVSPNLPVQRRFLAHKLETEQKKKSEAASVKNEKKDEPQRVPGLNSGFNFTPSQKKLMPIKDGQKNKHNKSPSLVTKTTSSGYHSMQLSVEAEEFVSKKRSEIDLNSSFMSNASGKTVPGMKNVKRIDKSEKISRPVPPNRSDLQHKPNNRHQNNGGHQRNEKKAPPKKILATVRRIGKLNAQATEPKKDEDKENVMKKMLEDEPNVPKQTFNNQKKLEKKYYPKNTSHGVVAHQTQSSTSSSSKFSSVFVNHSKNSTKRNESAGTHRGRSSKFYFDCSRNVIDIVHV